MSDDEGRDFIVLGEAILDDGEVSAEEAFRMAEWLNDHPHVAHTWPASEVVKPLRDIWADGTVNRHELHEFARLLVRLLREKSVRPEGEDAGAAAIQLPAIVSPTASGAVLPSLDARVQVPAWRDSKEAYEVDLNGPHCSCPEWRHRRSHLPAGHLTRCCKHIFAAYAQLPRAPETEGWLLAYFDHGWPADPRTNWELITVEREKVLISSGANKGWANVFARDENEYKRFSYNPAEHRWAYGSEPRWAWVITDAVRALEETSQPHRTSEAKRPRDEAQDSEHGTRRWWNFFRGQ